LQSKGRHNSGRGHVNAEEGSSEGGEGLYEIGFCSRLLVIPKQNGKGKPILAGISVEVKPVCKNPKI
jgi:hypothetical protein